MILLKWIIQSIEKIEHFIAEKEIGLVTIFGREEGISPVFWIDSCLERMRTLIRICFGIEESLIIIGEIHDMGDRAVQRICSTKKMYIFLEDGQRKITSSVWS